LIRTRVLCRDHRKRLNRTNLIIIRNTPIFWCAAANTNWGKKVVTLWTSHPDLDINISDRDGGHVLHWCTDKIPRSVLDHPKLDINVLNSQGMVLTVVDRALPNLVI
jgi:hypothetical protein